VGERNIVVFGARADRNKPWINTALIQAAKGSSLAHGKPSLPESENKAKMEVSQGMTVSERRGDALPLDVLSF
jgi:hypothetical protein